MIEKELCKVLMEFGDKQIDEDDNPFIQETVITYIVNKMINNFDFESPICFKIFNLIKEEYAKGIIHPLSFFYNHPDYEIAQFAVKYCNNDTETLDNWGLKSKDTIKLVQYGENYAQEVQDIIDQAHLIYFEKLSKHIMEITAKELKDDKTLTDTAMKQLLLQNEFMEKFKLQTKNIKMCSEKDWDNKIKIKIVFK